MDDQVRKTQLEWIAQEDAGRYTGESHNGKPVMAVEFEIFVTEKMLEGATAAEFLSRLHDQRLHTQGLHRIGGVMFEQTDEEGIVKTTSNAIRIELPLALREREEPQ
jgi:hypothetical protein